MHDNLYIKFHALKYYYMIFINIDLAAFGVFEAEKLAFYVYYDDLLSTHKHIRSD